MACTRQDLQLIRGISKTLRLTVVDEEGDRVSLIGATVYFRAKVLVTDVATVIAKDSGTPAEITILDQTPGGATVGQADIFLVPTDTSGLALVPHVYDIWAVLSSGKRYSVIDVSKLYIEQAVTEL